MTRDTIEDLIRRGYAARLNGDLDFLVEELFGPDPSFTLIGNPEESPVSAGVTGKAPFRVVLGSLMELVEWQEHAFLDILIDGSRAAVRSRLKVRSVPTGLTADLEIFDLLTFEGGRIVAFVQFVDTLTAARLMGDATPVIARLQQAQATGFA
jgi:ketosteroid isomerase-like protein